MGKLTELDVKILDDALRAQYVIQFLEKTLLDLDTTAGIDVGDSGFDDANTIRQVIDFLDSYWCNTRLLDVE